MTPPRKPPFQFGLKWLFGTTAAAAAAAAWLDQSWLMAIAVVSGLIWVIQAAEVVGESLKNR